MKTLVEFLVKRRTAVAAILLLTVTAASPAPAAAQAAKQAAPPEMSAADFSKDFTSLKGAEVMKKYRDGVVVSGPVLRTLKEMDGSIKVWLDATGGKWVSLSFKDKEAAVTSKAVKTGDSLKAKCEVRGRDGQLRHEHRLRAALTLFERAEQHGAADAVPDRRVADFEDGDAGVTNGDPGATARSVGSRLSEPETGGG